MAIVRSTKVLLATKPSTKLTNHDEHDGHVTSCPPITAHLKQMLSALLSARTRGGSISATTTQTSVP